MMRKPVVIVEGLIGIGKSTLTEELGAALGPNCLTLLEPDERDNANPYLASFYADMPRWGTTMQLHLLGLRYRMQLRAQHHANSGAGPALLDRSFYGDVCFARLGYKDGWMNEAEFSTYEMLYQEMSEHVLFPSICLHLLGDPTIVAQRINKRLSEREGRKSEAGIPLQYLEDLAVEIDRMVNILGDHGTRVYTVMWDTERDTPEHRAQTIQSLVRKIEAYKPPDLHRRVI